MESELDMQLDNLPNGISPPTLSEFFLRTQNQSMIGFSPMLSSSAHGGDPRLQVDKTVMYNGLLFNGDNSNFQEVPSESLREMFSSHCSYASSSVVPTSLNCGYDAILSDNRFLMQMQNQDNANQWLLSNSTNSLPYETSIPHSNELSLSLASCQGTRDFSPAGFGSNTSRTQPFSREMISGSGYLTSLQQILSEISSFSLEGVEHISYSSAFAGSTSNVMAPSNAESSNTRQEVEAKKSQLLGLLESVDDCYGRCLDEIHTVISAFHAATELDPQLYSCFTLRTISFFYKNLRERISNEILVIGMDSNSKMGSFEKSFIQKQWALRKDQQLWRPQRGLPERSVSILRAWMFENFLHPYPKDSEKHLLALKSGLTRSQVSNWFINARVRLWKPLVEDMCLELNKRKGVARQNNEGTSDNSNRMRNQLSIYEHSQRINS